MLGKKNRQRYVDEYSMLDPQYNPFQILVKSTDIERTIQSSYSELLGMYQPSNKNNEM